MTRGPFRVTILLLLLYVTLAGAGCAPPGAIPRACQEWYDRGKLEGYSSGYNEGFAKGKESGYNEGYARGLQEGKALCPQCPTCPTCPKCPEYSYPYYCPYWYCERFCPPCRR